MIVGGIKLSDTQARRLSFGLYAPSGRGKTLGAASFGGGEFGKIIVILAEVGPEEGAGGLTTLLYAKGIHDRIASEDVLVLNVTNWEEMREQFAWLRVNAPDLSAEGYSTLVLDGGTALSYIIRQEIVNRDPEYSPTPKRHNIMGQLVPSLLGSASSPMELYQYDLVYDRYIDMHSKLKQLPFTFITTFLEKEAFDEETKKNKIGLGPKLIGKQLPAQIPAEVDGFFHCEINDEGQHVWLTKNDPSKFGAPSPAVAKHRFGNIVNQYEPADGAKLLQKLGVYPTDEGLKLAA